MKKYILIYCTIATLQITNPAFGEDAAHSCADISKSTYYNSDIPFLHKEEIYPLETTHNSHGCNSTGDETERYFASYTSKNIIHTGYKVIECKTCASGYHTKQRYAGASRCPESPDFYWTECAKDCDSTLCHNGDWIDISISQQKRTTAYCAMKECYTGSDEYRCKKGYQGGACSPCPVSGAGVAATTKGDGAQSEMECYIPTTNGLEFSDYNGSGIYTKDDECWWSIM